MLFSIITLITFMSYIFSMLNKKQLYENILFFFITWDLYTFCFSGRLRIQFFVQGSVPDPFFFIIRIRKSAVSHAAAAIIS